MKAVVLRGIEAIRVEEVETPCPQSGEVLVRVKACGICGSDVARFQKGNSTYPVILGHEFAGEVAAVGKEIKRWKEGDRVIGLPLVPCFQCSACRRGYYSLCVDYCFIGSRRDGAMAEYCVVPERNIMKMSGGISLEDGALIEPVTVPLHAFLLIPPSRRKGRIAILGMGAIGLFALQWARFFDMKRIIAVDVKPKALAAAKGLGARCIINASRGDAVHAVLKNSQGEGVDIVMETAGAAASQIGAWCMVKRRGCILQVGTAHEPVTFPAEAFERLLRREITIRGSWMSYSKPFPGGEWRTASRAIAARKVRPARVVSRKIGLEDVPDVMARLKHPSSVWGKVLICV